MFVVVVFVVVVVVVVNVVVHGYCCSLYDFCCGFSISLPTDRQTDSQTDRQGLQKSLFPGFSG